MAKKTNKTDHVLNLLAGSPEMEEESVKSTKAGKKELTGANVQVIDAQEDDDLIANEVNRLLEEELEESENLEKEVTGDTSDLALKNVERKEPTASPAHGGVAEEPKMEPTVSEEADSAAVADLEDAKAAEEPAALPVEDEKVEEARPVVVAESELELDSDEDGADYVFLNVMGKLVKERVGEYMEEFGNCTCSRCIADTTALALIHLPPKYVVVSKNAETPLLNFYRQHYAAQITVEITKACTKVQQHPHHNRD